MSNRYIAVAIAVIVVIATGFYIMGMWENKRDTTNVNASSFEECVDAGFTVMRSLPEQCSTPDGKVFTKNSDTSQNTPQNEAPNTPSQNTGSTTPNEPVFCTMDAFQCQDGSWVGRTGPNCEFVCPAE